MGMRMESGHFERMHAKALMRLDGFKFTIFIIVIANCIVAGHIGYNGENNVFIGYIIYIVSLVLSLLSIHTLNWKWCLPAICLSFPNFFIPLTYFLYLFGAFNYCFFVENWNRTEDKPHMIYPFDDKCMYSFPYSFNIKLAYTLILYGVMKLVEFLTVYKLAQAVAREKHAIKREHHLIDNVKKAVIPEDSDDEMIVFKRHTMAAPGMPFGMRSCDNPSIFVSPPPAYSRELNA